MLGLDASVIELFNKDLSIKRVKKDVQSDLIFAPHYNFIYEYASNEIFDNLTPKLKSGKYNPRLPISIEVIKSNGFCRIGSILEPSDRLIYQMLVDNLAPIFELEIDRKRVFSNILNSDDSEGYMFEKSNESFKKFQESVNLKSRTGGSRYILKADVASFFDRVYQHSIGNLLYSSGADSRVVSFLEKFLLQLSQNDSHGIIQGVCASDFLGNISLCPIDAQHLLSGIEFSRYVDDMYLFFQTLNEANLHKVTLSSWLRREGLSLNESKTKIYRVEDLIHEETEVDRLFEVAKSEVVGGLADVGYETNVFWDLDLKIELSEKDIDLRTVQKLLDYKSVEREKRLKIERFCLPIFSVVDDDYAIDYVIEKFPIEHSMAQVYYGYLRKFVNADKNIALSVENLILTTKSLFDYQKMWLYATLIYADSLSSQMVIHALNDLKKIAINPTVRAVCAIIIGKHGTASFRKILKNHYENEPSEYVKAAILYASQFLPPQ